MVPYGWNKIHLYLNGGGEDDDDVTETIVDPYTDIESGYIGTNAGSTIYSECKLDELAIWNRALSPEKI